MTDVLGMFTLGFGVTLAVILVAALAERVRKGRGPEAPAPDTRIAAALADTNRRVEQLSLRLGDLQEQLAEDRLTILDTAEKVAARLSDRERKRRRHEEVPEGEHDEVPDPSLLLARARAAYPLPNMPAADNRQLTFLEGQAL